MALLQLTCNIYGIRMNTVDERLKTIILSTMRIGIDLEDIEEETDLINDLLFDSIQVLRLISRIEEEFAITIENEDSLVELVQNYGLLKGFIEKTVTGDSRC
ncbi:acyl carrier protein [Clostridium sp. KNHs205]|uniref:acyl carrier protein n=1 Tax=Clostridium sp. KNHs205 TaxID=1449050 RepID=UPI00051ACE42|nr:acyl carrier protein [Clostridium sp. KNHs205]